MWPQSRQKTALARLLPYGSQRLGRERTTSSRSCKTRLNPNPMQPIQRSRVEPTHVTNAPYIPPMHVNRC